MFPMAEGVFWMVVIWAIARSSGNGRLVGICVVGDGHSVPMAATWSKVFKIRGGVDSMYVQRMAQTARQELPQSRYAQREPEGCCYKSRMNMVLVQEYNDAADAIIKEAPARSC